MYALGTLTVFDPEQGKAFAALPVVTEVVRRLGRCLGLSRIVVQGLGKPSALSYLLRTIASVAIVLDSRLARATEVAVAELMRLADEYGALVALVDRVVSYQVGQGVVDRLDAPCRARQAPLQIPRDLNSALTRLGTRIDQLKARCATAAAAPGLRGPKSAVLVLRATPQRARAAQQALAECATQTKRANKRARPRSKSRSKSDGAEEHASGGEDDEDGNSSSYFERPLEWRESSKTSGCGDGGDDDYDDDEAVVCAEVRAIGVAPQEYESSDQRFAACFGTTRFDVEEVD